MRKWVLIGLAVGLLFSNAAPRLAAQAPGDAAAPNPGTPAAPAAAEPVKTVPVVTEAGSAQLRHPWGRFKLGAWALVRVVNETFDDKGAVVSTDMIETRTTLVKIEEDGVTLRLETSAWVSGKQVDAKPQEVKQCYHGGLCIKNVQVSYNSPVKIAVDGSEIECKVESVKLTDGDIRTSIRTYYNDTVSPFVFKRESETTNLTKKSTLSTLTIQVDALNMPCEVLDQIRSAAHYRVVRKQASGAVTTTLAYMSPEIPGSTIRHSSKQVDQKGRIVSRSILELTDFGLQSPKKRVGWLQRFREAKSRRSLRRQVECLPE